MPQSLRGCIAKYYHHNRSELLAFYYKDHEIVEDRLEELKLALSINDLWTEENCEVLDKFSSFMRHELEHHLLEEELLLFPLIAKVLGEASGPVRAMNTEHSQLRMLRAELTAEIEACRRNKVRTERFNCLFQQVDECLAEHIYKENYVLFPMAEQILSEDQKANALCELLNMRHRTN
ncbi:hemerythrin domain-containing protein [Brevibacillus ginsengisoli]|uniref:hemerythrin domain-containing protein n=1 Tax=Brevibacillus ginsengisoli TaxID=363854 RepID=UPI003CED4E28